MRRGMAVLASAGILAGGAFVAAPAHADEMSYPVSGSGGRGFFDTRGDIFKLKDTKKDHAHPVIKWKVGGWTGFCTNTKGYGKWKTCNENFKEGKKIAFRLLTYRGSRLIGASGWKHGITGY